MAKQHPLIMSANSDLKDSSAMDVITIGRSCVDLYGEQIGGRLEDMASFAKYVGGSPTNTAIGAARLGLHCALLTRVGADHMGRFVREQLVREGVVTDGVKTDPDRLTALAMLGVRDQDTFPLIFYRENCADMALDEADIDPEFICRAKALTISGTHLSRPGTAAACFKAARLLRANGGRVILDIDYRPVLWGLAPLDRGEDRFIADKGVSQALATILPMVDLIVGTDDEIRILGGCKDTIEALLQIRAQSPAPIVLKLGAQGCAVFEGPIPAATGDWQIVPGFPVDVFNVLGAGDAFMAGLLRGWLKGEPLANACRWANACGAIVVSRHGCAPAMPTWDELMLFLSRQDWPLRLREAPKLEQVHWSGTRAPAPDGLMVLAIDHRTQFDTLLLEHGHECPDAVIAFKAMVANALEAITQDAPDIGLLVDGRFGARALEAAADGYYWIGRPIEVPGSRPIRFEGSPDVAVTLREWPLKHVVKCLLLYHPDDPEELRREQDAQILRLFAACRQTRHELLLEIIASPHGQVEVDTTARVMDHIYRLGVYPDWWKLEPSRDPAVWDAVSAVIACHDPNCRGVLLLGLSAPLHELIDSFPSAARSPVVKGFAVGRTIWHEAATLWFKGVIDDGRAMQLLTNNFLDLVAGWRAACKQT